MRDDAAHVAAAPRTGQRLHRGHRGDALEARLLPVDADEDALALTTNEWAPSADPSGKTARVYQLSELVGRGHVAEAELT